VLLFVGRQTAVGPRRVPADGAYWTTHDQALVRATAHREFAQRSAIYGEKHPSVVWAGRGAGSGTRPAAGRSEPVGEGARVRGAARAAGRRFVSVAPEDGALSLEEVLADGQEPWAARYAAPS
jgi:hypothetical protein